MQITTLLITIEIAATIAFAMSGLIEATRKKMDVVGVFSVTFVSAFAGGTVRDILINRRPFFWVENSEYIWLILALVLAAPLLLRGMELRVTDRVMEVADAIGLGLFTISGASLALGAGMPLVVALLLGSITAVFGGVTRDVLCNEVPLVFVRGELYTSAAWAGALLLVGLQNIGVSPVIAAWSGMAAILAARLLAMTFRITLPTYTERQ